MKEIITLLEKLAEKLGVTVQYIFQVYTRQAFWNGVSDLIQYALLIAGIYVWWKYREKFWAVANDESISRIVWGVCGVFLAIILVVAFLCFPNTIKEFVNPECWALEKIFDSLKGLK
jgi:hypothetical protein